MSDLSKLPQSMVFSFWKKLCGQRVSTAIPLCELVSSPALSRMTSITGPFASEEAKSAQRQTLWKPLLGFDCVSSPVPKPDN